MKYRVFNRLRKRPAQATAILALLITAAGLAAVRTYTVDDAFIVLRYARNIGRGLGPVFNPGERVEGCTSPLWLALAAIGTWLPFAPETTLKLISLAGAAVLLAAAARRWRRTPIVAVATLALIGLHGPFLIAMASGLETAVNAVLIGLLLLAAHHASRRRHSNLTWIGAAALLCRPENGLLAGVHGLYLWLTRPWERRTLVFTAATWLGLLLALTAARYSYYGRLVSNTSVSKLTGPLETLDHAVFYLNIWMSQSWPLLLGLALGFLVRRSRRFATNALLLAVGQAAFVIIAGGDWMPGLRFMLPASIVALLTAGEVTHQLARIARAQRRFPRQFSTRIPTAVWCTPRAATLACIILIGFATLHEATTLRATRWSLANYERLMTALSEGPVAFLKRAARSSDVLAARDIGVLGYQLECRVLDLVGLTDAHIAETSGLRHRERLDLDYVYSRNPRFFLIQSEKSPTGESQPCRLARIIQSDPRFSAYEIRGRWTLPERAFCELYERRASPADSLPTDPMTHALPVAAAPLSADGE